jgi:putative transposase
MKYQYTNKQKILNENRYWFIQNYFNQIVAKIVSYCIENDITEIFIGKNVGWKTETNMGKKNNQKFLAIPHAKLIDKLNSKCEEL